MRTSKQGPEREERVVVILYEISGNTEQFKAENAMRKCAFRYPLSSRGGAIPASEMPQSRQGVIMAWTIEKCGDAEVKRI